MKFIRKGRVPAALRKFSKEHTEATKFNEFRGQERRGLHAMMLKEQGWLCAYSMRRINEDKDNAADFHIEHIRPQHKYPELRFAYANLVLCSPADETKRCEWGARHKDRADVNDNNFVSPLRSDCETRFAYLPSGEVKATADDDAAAKSTIVMLNLNHRELVAERLAALRSFGLVGGSVKPIGRRAAEQLQLSICERGDEDKFPPFCVVIRQLAEIVAQKAARRAARLRKAR